MADGLILVEDYAKWRRAVKELDTGLDKELKAGLRQLGVKVSKKAKGEADNQGLIATGELMRKISPSVRMNEVVIAAKAKRPASSGARGGRYARKPFPYPMVYEFGGRGEGSTGPRAFLAPAVQKSQDLIRDELLKVMDNTARDAGWQ
jgi:hypothetical protein